MKQSESFSYQRHLLNQKVDRDEKEREKKKRTTSMGSALDQAYRIQLNESQSEGIKIVKQKPLPEEPNADKRKRLYK